MGAGLRGFLAGVVLTSILSALFWTLRAPPSVERNGVHDDRVVQPTGIGAASSPEPNPGHQDQVLESDLPVSIDATRVEAEPQEERLRSLLAKELNESFSRYWSTMSEDEDGLVAALARTGKSPFDDGMPELVAQARVQLSDSNKRFAEHAAALVSQFPLIAKYPVGTDVPSEIRSQYLDEFSRFSKLNNQVAFPHNDEKKAIIDKFIGAALNYAPPLQAHPEDVLATVVKEEVARHFAIYWHSTVGDKHGVREIIAKSGCSPFDEEVQELIADAFHKIRRFDSELQQERNALLLRYPMIRSRSERSFSKAEMSAYEREYDAYRQELDTTLAHFKTRRADVLNDLENSLGTKR